MQIILSGFAPVHRKSMISLVKDDAHMNRSCLPRPTRPRRQRVFTVRSDGVFSQIQIHINHKYVYSVIYSKIGIVEETP